MKTKHPVHNMVVGAVNNHDDVVSSQVDDIKCLEKVVLTWIEKMADG